MPTVSIVIPTYNQAHFLPETLESIARQTYTDYEVIVVDDGSTDSTPELLRHYSAQVTYVRQSNSGGCSHPRNRGIELARGKYIAVFDSDDLMAPSKLERQVAVLEANPDIGFVFTDFVNFQGTHFFAPHSQSCIRFRAQLGERRPQGAYVLQPELAFGMLVEENFIGASSMFMRKTLLDEIGLFDESLKSSEDLDMFFRVTRAHPIAFIDELGHFRRLHDAGMTKNFLKMSSNLIRVYGKHLYVAVDAETRRALRRRVADVHCAVGYFYRNAGNFSAAMQSYRSSAFSWPTHWRTYSGALKTLGMRIGVF